MGITASGWQNKNGTSSRQCSKCGTWKDHWVNLSGNKWPATCSVLTCNTAPTLGAHIINNEVSGEKIVPMCNGCNKLTSTFSLKDGITLIAAISCQ